MFGNDCIYGMTGASDLFIMGTKNCCLFGSCRHLRSRILYAQASTGLLPLFTLLYTSSLLLPLLWGAGPMALMLWLDGMMMMMMTSSLSGRLYAIGDTA
jgi:hypothetical protein